MGNRGTCKSEGCAKDVVGKGYCIRHYNKWRRGQMPKPRYATCKTKGCKKRQVAFAHCEEHQKIKAAPAAAEAPAPAAEAPAAEG